MSSVKHNEVQRRFVVELTSGADPDTVAFVEYGIKDRLVDLYHTETVPKYRGKGYAKLAVDAALDWAKDKGLDVIPSCSYAKKIYEERGSKL